jgi:molybdopterin converting factor small subunit
MSVQVRVPTVLRTYTGGAKEVTTEGSTVGEIFEALDTAHPGIKERVVDEDGKLRRFVNVYVDNEDVRFADGLSTAVGDGSQVSIIPSVAGG